MHFHFFTLLKRCVRPCSRLQRAIPSSVFTAPAKITCKSHLEHDEKCVQIRTRRACWTDATDSHLQDKTLPPSVAEADAFPRSACGWCPPTHTGHTECVARHCFVIAGAPQDAVRAESGTGFTPPSITLPLPPPPLRPPHHPAAPANPARCSRVRGEFAHSSSCGRFALRRLLWHRRCVTHTHTSVAAQSPKSHGRDTTMRHQRTGDVVAHGAPGDGVAAPGEPEGSDGGSPIGGRGCSFHGCIEPLPD